MKPSNDIFYGLDIQKEYIAVVQYTAKGNAVTLVALQPIAGNSPEAVSEELGILKSKFKFVDSRVNCSLPLETAIIKTFPVDASDNAVEAALAWELEQNIIGSADEYVFDFQPLSTPAQNFSHYQLVAYRKERIQTLSALLKTHKLQPRCIDVDAFALINMFEASYPEQTGQPAVIIHAETADARILLTQNGQLLDFECIRFDPEPDPGMLSNYILEALPRLGNGMQPVQTPFYATGLLFSQDGYIDSLQGWLPGISILHPFRKIECRIGVDENKLSGYLSQLSVAVGLAIRGDDRT